MSGSHRRDITLVRSKELVFTSAGFWKGFFAALGCLFLQFSVSRSRRNWCRLCWVPVLGHSRDGLPACLSSCVVISGGPILALCSDNHIFARLVSFLPQDEVGVPGSSSSDLLHWTTATTMKVLSNTTTTTRAVLQAVGAGQWWATSLTHLRPREVALPLGAQVCSTPAPRSALVLALQLHPLRVTEITS